jgi:hypothetical protein
MKKLLLFAGIAIFVTSCNNKGENAGTGSTDTTKMATSTAEEPVLAFQLDEPYKDWQPGDKQHAVTVMTGLKAYVDGNIDACVATFGDSVDLHFDYVRKKLSNDSLKKYFTQERANYGNITIKMDDWESVISKDKKTEYVTMWYKQIMTDKKGKTDSLGIVDDCKIVNGKIVELDEKLQHFPIKK